MEIDREELNTLRQNIEFLNQQLIDEMRAANIGIPDLAMLQIQLQAMMVTMAHVTGTEILDVAAMFNYQCTEMFHAYLKGLDIEAIKAEQARQKLLGGIQFKTDGHSNGN